MAKAADVRTVVLNDFGIGIDRRPGGVTTDFRAAADIVNYMITPGRKLIRRPACTRLSGQLDAQTQGHLIWNGVLYTVAPAGTTVHHTITDLPIETLWFDTPPQCLTTPWTLLDMQGTPAGIVALIEHTAQSAAAPKRTFLHVWDNQRPTFVWDHACPTTWAPALPDGLYGETQPANAYAYFKQRMTVLAGRVFLSRADGNVAFSAVNRPRVWSDRTVDHILQHGEWWYWIGRNGPTIMEQIVPVPYTDLTYDKRYAAYVLEYFHPTQHTWLQIDEVILFTSGKQYQLEPVTDPWDPSRQATRLRIVFPNADGVVFRFRAIARPPAKVESGLYVAPPRHVVGGVLTHETGSVSLGSMELTGLPVPGAPYFIQAVHPQAPIVVPAYALGVPGAMPLNGQQRFWSRIVAHVHTNASGDFVYNLTGTVSITGGDTKVVGTGTAFLSEVSNGDTIVINDERRVVKHVVSDTVLELEAPMISSYSGVALRDTMYTYASDVGSGNTWFAQLVARVTLHVAGAEDAGMIGTAAYVTKGSTPVVLADVSDVLFVQYPSRIQLWRADSPTTLELLAQHTESVAEPDTMAVAVDGLLAIVTSQGIKLLSPTGLNKEYVEVQHVNERLRGMVQPSFQVLGWWSARRVLIAAPNAAPPGQPLPLFVLHYYPSEQIVAWTRWEIEGLTSVAAIQEYETDILLIQPPYIWRMPWQFTSAHDQYGVFTSIYRGLPCDFGAPTYFKKLLRCDLSQRGQCRLNVYVNPSAPDPAVLGPPTVVGVTHGLQRIPLMTLASTVALEIVCDTDAQHEFDELVLEYTLKGR